MTGSMEEECGVARKSNCGRRTRAATLEADPFAAEAQKGQFAKNAIPSTRVAVVGSALPLAVFIAIAGLFTYLRDTQPAMVWLAVALALDAVVVTAWPQRRAEDSGSAPLARRVEWLPMFFGLTALVFAGLLGDWNATWLEMYTRATHLRHHVDVLPTDNPRVYASAGVLRFADGSQVDIDASAGFRAFPNTYCAAPIRGPADPAGPLGFWAVGKDCCDSRGGFTCNSAADPKAQSGIQIPADKQWNHWMYAGGETEHGAAGRGNYWKAVRMSAAAIGEVAAEDPVLVVWERSPVAIADRAWWYATTAYLLEVLFAVLCCFFSWYLIRSVSGALPSTRMA